MLSAFGIDDSRISKDDRTAAQKRTDRQHTAVGVGVAGTGVYGYQAGTSVRARNTARRTSDPAHAHGVADTLRQHRGQSMNATMAGLRAQSDTHQKAKAQHSGVKGVRDTADRWSSTFGQVKRIRGAYDRDAKVPGLGRALLRPVKSKAESDSNTMRNLNNAKTPSPDLYRGMKTTKAAYKVGDEVDFHDLTSWSADHGVAHRFASSAAGKKASGGSHSHVFHREPGHGTSYEAASPRFQQREWVAGGKHKVVGISPNGAIRVARIVKSAFGVDDSRISKASPDGNDLHVLGAPNVPTKRQRRQKALAAGGIGAAMAGAGGAALKLKPVPLVVTAGISGGGSTLQSMVSSRPFKAKQPQS